MSDKVRTSRGISKAVWDKRPYTRWTAENYAEVMAEAYKGLTGKQIGYMKRLANQQPGWIINRRNVPGADHVYPEIRPDGPVRTGPPTMHWHGVGEPPEELPANADGEPGEWYPDGGWRVFKRGTEAWKKHCEKINGDPNEDDEQHELNMEPHTHANEAKYVFPPAERVTKWGTPHDHTSTYFQKDKEALRTHIEKYHDGHAGPFGEHSHGYRDKSDEALARRLDIHKMARDRLEAAQRVYFGIEGCLKADSILTAIIEDDRPESVFSVPSVSLWATPQSRTGLWRS